MHSEFLPQRVSCYVFSIEMNNLLYINDFCALCWKRHLLYVFNYLSYLDVPHLDLLIIAPLFFLLSIWDLLHFPALVWRALSLDVLLQGCIIHCPYVV